MSRVPVRLLVVLLVCLLETRAETVSGGSNPPRELNNSSLNVVPSNDGRGEAASNNKEDYSIRVRSPEDNDPAESSETIVYNRFANPPEDEDSGSSEEEPEEGSEEPEAHTVPYSEHETLRRVPTKPKYSAPGQWAKPKKEKNISEEDVPSRLYAQVRRTHTVRRLPRKKAFENAESEEERANAARLRQVVRNTKVNTVYTEEGYEDSAYDHAGHVRDADFDEGYARKSREQLAKKKTAGDRRKVSPKSERYKKIDPEEFKDYDEDYRDYGNARGRSKMDEEENQWTKSEYPKMIAEKGARELQEDVERVAEEMERGSEMNKLADENASSRLKTVTASPEEDNYNLKRSRGRNRNQQDVHQENYPTSRTLSDENMVSTEYGVPETTTMANIIDVSSMGPMESYRYDVEGNPPNEVVDIQRGNETPTTMSYSQLLWDYFRTKQEQTTPAPFMVESATMSPNFLLPSSDIEDAFAPFSAYAEQLSTPFPISEPSNQSPQKLVEAAQNHLPILEDVKWQANNIQQPLKPDQEQYPGAGLANDLIVDSISSLDSTEANLAEVLKGPVTFRKPRYKITVRQKPVESFETDVTNDDTEATTATSITVDPKYVKMLMHLRNEESRKLQSSPPGNSFHFQRAEGAMRPTSQKEDSYQSWSPQGPYGRTPTLRAQSLIPHSLRAASLGPPSLRLSSLGHPSLRSLSSGPPSLIPSSIGSPSLGPPSLGPHSARSPPIGYPSRGPPPPGPPSSRPPSFGPPSLRSRQRASPSSSLLPPEHSRTYKEAGDYVYGGTKRARNVPRPGFRLEATSRLRAKRRERRSADETIDVVAKRSASTAVANRGEIEQSARGLAAEERNPLRKVTRSVEVGLVPDAILGERSGDPGKGSRASTPGGSQRTGESVSFAAEEAGEVTSELDGAEDDGEVGVGGGSVARNGDRKKLETRPEARAVKKGIAQARGKKKFGLEAGETEMTKDKKIESEEPGGKVEAGDTLRRKRSHSGLGPYYPKEATVSHSNSPHLASTAGTTPKTLVEENKDGIEVLDHESLLEQSPKITDDEISKEIEARFNDEDQKDIEDENEDNEDRKVEVEVPDLPDFDYVEEATEEEKADFGATTEASLDKAKYPFYEDEKLPSPSALKYATDPRRVPGKTFGRMNFYKSRDLYKHCDEVEPNLDVLPKEEEPVADKDVNQSPQRLKGLGDKLDCFKAKYFDEDPFDNPLFLEKEVEDPLPPLEMKSKQFASRIMLFPKEDEQNIVQKSTKKTEDNHQNHKTQKTQQTQQAQHSLTQRRQRKPDTTARAPKSRRVRIKSYPRQVKVTRPRLIRIKSSNVRYVKPRRPQKVIRRPVASASELSSSYTPYQNQVYEDVMGTIKNMANSYQVEEITTDPSSKEDATTEISEESTNKSSNSVKSTKKEKDRKSSNSDERSSNASSSGSPPPRYFNRHRMSYKTTRVPQKGKPRVQLLQLTPNGLRPVSHLQRIVRYKRAAMDALKGPSDRSDESSSTEVSSKEAASSEESKEVQEGQRPKTKLNLKISDPVAHNWTSSSRGLDPKGKSKAPKTVPSNEKLSKVVYTIRDRIRFSKPKEESTRFGKFTNETEMVEDRRRREPRYNYIKRKKPASSTTESSPTSTERVTTARNDEVNVQESTKENRNIQRFLDEASVANPPGESIHQIDTTTEGSLIKTAYAVHENLSEEQTHQPGAKETTEPTGSTESTEPRGSTGSTETPEISRLKTYLDTPSYDFSSEELKKSLFSKSNESSPLNFTDSNEYTKPSPFDDESSEKAETNANPRPDKGSSEETASKSSDSEGKSFFKYWSRPSSPAESYEDEKYTQIGPRVNKPEFFHPPFSFLRSKKTSLKSSSEEDSGETEESGEKEEYVFPWQGDKVYEKRRRKRNRYYDKPIGEYEYPWDRRERLTSEKKRRKMDKRRRLLPDEDEDYDESHGMKYRRNVYPRGKVRYWGRDDSSEEGRSDNIESSSETRPVKKYSSRYSSKKLPARNNTQSKRVQEISRAIKEALEGGSEETPKALSSEETTLLRRNSNHSTNIDSEETTSEPRNHTNPDFIGAKRNESSNGSLRNSLDNVESRLAVKKVSEALLPRKEATQSSRKRRKPVKSLSDVETTAKSTGNRGRRRQKPVNSSTISTTPIPKLARRRPLKLVDDVEDAGLKVTNKLGDDTSRVENSTVENGRVINVDDAMKRRVEEGARENTKGLMKEEINKSTKGQPKAETKESINGQTKEAKDKLSELKNDQEKTIKAESESIDDGNKFGHDIGDHDNYEGKKLLEDDGKFDFMDDRIEALSGFVISDDVPGDNDDFRFDGIIKSDAAIPQNRAAQLSTQESREIITTKSWVSQNYNF
ncbi:uncharacterized protein LOC144477182 [Augochlora pura]